MKKLIYILAFTAVLSSCTKIEKVDVQALNKEFVDAWNDRNSGKLNDMLAEDVDFVQGEVHYSGKNEVSDKWVRETLGTIDELRLNTVSTGSDSEMAYEAGTFSVDVLPATPDQPYGEGEGNFMLLWKKDKEGNWKLSYAQLEDLPVKVKTR